MSASRVLPSACVLIALLVPNSPVPAKAVSIFGGKPKESFQGAPPLPAPANIQVDRKQPKRIPLRVLGPQSESITFLLRTPPSHGRLKLLTNTAGTEAWVEYFPPEDRSFTTDQFGFAASNSKGVSAEATIVIQILDKAGRIDLPQRIDFPPTKVGLVSEQKLPIKNLGDTALSASITAPAGWTCRPDTFHLEPQQGIVLELILAPSIAGNLKGDLVFSHQPEKPIKLFATAEDWIQAEPDPLKLFAVSNSAQRETLLKLSNHNLTPEVVLLSSIPPLDHPEEVALNPGQSKQITVRGGKLSKEPSSGLLKLTRKGSPEDLAVSRLLLWHAEASAPLLRITSNLASPTIVPPNKHLFTPITLENAGGNEGVWTIQVPPPFAVDSTALRILPGKSIDLHVFTVITPTERAEGLLKIQGLGQSFEIPLLTKPESPSVATTHPPSRSGQSQTHTTTATNRPQRSSATPHGAPDSESPLPLPPTATTAAKKPAPSVNAAHIQLANRAFLPGIAIAGSKLRNVTDRSAILEVPDNPAIPIEKLLVESRLLVPDPHGPLRVSWQPLPNVQISRDQSKHLLFTFQKLEPNLTYTIRVLGPILPSGKRVALHQCDIATRPKAPWLTLGKTILLIGGLAAILLLRKRAQH